MAYGVEFKTPLVRLGKSDVTFKVKQDEEMLGTLLVSKGAVTWFPKDTTNGHKLSWVDFGKAMVAKSNRTEKR